MLHLNMQKINVSLHKNQYRWIAKAIKGKGQAEMFVPLNIWKGGILCELIFMIQGLKKIIP